MATFGYEAFENDEATEWIEELDSSESNDLLSATLQQAVERVVNDTMGFADSLHILADNRRVMSIAGTRSNKFLNGVYPIPLREILSRLGNTGGDTVDLDLLFDEGNLYTERPAIRVVR